MSLLVTTLKEARTGNIVRTNKIFLSPIRRNKLASSNRTRTIELETSLDIS